MAKPKKERCSVKEFTIFSIFFGIILGIFGYFAATTKLNDAPQLLGMSRNLAFGIPLLAIGAGFIAAGIWLQVGKAKSALYLSVFCGIALLAGDLAVELGIMGHLFAFNLVSIVIYALPLILISRLKPALARLDELNAGATASPA